MPNSLKKSITQDELIRTIAKEADLTIGTAKDVLHAFSDVIVKFVASGNRVPTPLGSFERAERSAREGRNPQTGQIIKIPASKYPKFKPSKAFKEKVNKG